MTPLRSIFVGVRPHFSDELAQSLAELRGELAQMEGIRPTRRENDHITLAFMGRPLRDEAEAAFAGCLSAIHDRAPFDVAFGKIASFGNRRHRHRVLFAEPAPHTSLTRLAQAFAPLADRADVHLHLTLARSNKPRHGRQLARFVGRRHLGTARVDAIYLMANDGTPTYVNLLTTRLVTA